MRKEFATYLSDQLRPHPRQSIADWSAANVDFSLAPNYDTPIHAPFDPQYAPYMIPVLEWLQDYTTREIWIRKCSRAAATEYLLCWMRWIVAVAPAPTYYLTADELTTKRFMESRIKRGMKACPPANESYKHAQATEVDIRFPNMDFRVAWPNAKGAFKQDGWANIIADEFPTWKGFAADMLRKRAGTYAFHKIVGLGSPDPIGKHPDGDPVILEYEATNQCRWMMPDPVTGNLFAWEFGGEGQSHGLKWPDDARDAETGEWDLERVRTEAYYITPDGTRIDNKDRAELTARGQWVSARPDAPSHIKGIWIVGPMVPFSDGDFGVLAYRFLEAKRRGHDSLRAYFYENWADVANMPNSSTAEETVLKRRELDYGRGQRFYEQIDDIPENAPKGLFLTIDVQKYHLWYAARWWVQNGQRTDSGLEEWGQIQNFDDLIKLVETIQPSAIGIDIGYAERYGETVDFCSYIGAIALKGNDKMDGDLNLRDDLDPSEGRKARGRTSARFSMLSFNTDVFRSKLLAAQRGETPFTWYIPKMVGRPYVRQVTSTHKIDGEWKRKKGHPDDHLFDCEVMQLALARYDNLIQ